MKFFHNKSGLITFICVLTSCTKFVAVSPPSTQLITSTVFTSDQTATAAVIGIYSNMMTTNLGFYGGGITLATGLSSDEFLNYSNSTDQSEFASDNLKPVNGMVKSLWGEPYQYIYAVNSILNGLSTSTGVSPATSAELQGEVKFIRALSYFYLLNLWGGVPLVLQTAYSGNDTLHRNTTDQIYTQIIQDLNDAQTQLLADYSVGGGERIRPNQSAATALLARVLLYNHDWSGAIKQSSAVINNSQFALVSDLSQVFLANNPEAIWQLQPVTPELNTWEGNFFILTDGPTSSPAEITLSPNLINDFEPGDLRKTQWTQIDSTQGSYNYYPFKYRVQTASAITEYYMVLRLAEQYLIRAEAEAQLGDIPSAEADVNIIRERAGLNDLPPSMTQVQCLAAIYQERRIELFAEWGHRWLDLIRTGLASSVLSPLKPGWKATDTLYPIPQPEIQNDPNLTQNPGY